jgi:hypothetical protein
MAKILNPVCSEAVFRIGKRDILVHTDITDGSWERFVKALKTASETDLRRCRVVEDGGADLDLLWRLVELRKDLGRETFAKISSMVLFDIEDEVVVIGKHFHIAERPGELFSALLEEGRNARVYFGKNVKNEAMSKIDILFRRWKEGKITRERFRAEGLSTLFWR